MSEVTQQSVLTAPCDICGAEINFENDVEIHELIECRDCGFEYEVMSLNPLIIEEAPMEAEDWGQ